VTSTWSKVGVTASFMYELENVVVESIQH